MGMLSVYIAFLSNVAVKYESRFSVFRACFIRQYQGIEPFRFVLHKGNDRLSKVNCSHSTEPCIAVVLLGARFEISRHRFKL